MKKIIGILMIMIMMLSTNSFATTPEGEVNYDDYIDLISLEDEIMPISAFNIVEDDIYRIEKQVILQDMVDGNVYIIAQDLKITGAVIEGNVYAMAESIIIENSEITGSVYAMGQTIQVTGEMNDIYALAGNMTIGKEAMILRNARIAADLLQVDGKIGKNLYATLEDLKIGETAEIAGEVNYLSPNQGIISEMAKIGDVQFHVWEEDEEVETNTVKEITIDIIKIAFRTLVIAWFILRFVHKYEKLKRGKTTDFLIAMCKGIGVLTLVPTVSILLIISIIGTALGVSLLAIYSVLLYIALPVIALEIAYRLLTAKQTETKIGTAKCIGIAIMVSVVLWAISCIPTIGGSIKFLFVLMGLGMLFDLMFQKIKNQPNNGENE